MAAALSEAGATRQVLLIGGDPAGREAVSAEGCGNKAASLARLDALGLPVPPAVVLSTVFCEEYFARGGGRDAGFRRELREGLRQLEKATGLQLGGRHPLLVSVRSSPPVSMPGMLETVLNVGLNETTVQGLLRATGNPTLVWDAYHRLLRAFAETVRGAASEPFDRLLAQYLLAAEVRVAHELDPLTLRSLARDAADLLDQLTGAPLPTDPLDQLECAVEAVFRSWNSPRALEYRRLHRLDAMSATAVIIQGMVFGNAGGSSGSGVGFTRDPTDGRNELYADFLFNAQGEDVVSGRQSRSDAARLARVLPAVQAELELAKVRLESEFRDMQDFEFTVQDGRLYFLQTRAGKRTAWAALQIAVDLVSSGVLDSAAALERLADLDLDAVERIRLRPDRQAAAIARGVPAGLGVAIGAVAFEAGRAQQMAREQPVILLRSEMSPDDIAGLAAAAGVLTTFGGRTSHAAVVARQLGKPCIVGCRALRIEVAARRCAIADQTFREGDMLTLDAETGDVYTGRVPVVTEKPAEALAVVEGWRRRLVQDPLLAS